MDIIKKPKANIMIDASNFDLFETCETRYHYRVNLRRSLPAINKNKSLDLGSIAHKGLESYYTDMMNGGIKFLDRLDRTANAMRTASSDPSESNLEIEETEGLIKVIQQNLDFWRWEDESLTIHSVESPFTYVLYEDEDIRILMSGQIDLLVDKPGLGRGADYLNLPIDHKTYSRESQLLRLSNQFQNYCTAVNSHYLVVNRIGLQTSKSPDEKFKRHPLSYDPIILSSWKDNVIKVMLGKYAECVASGYWPMNTTSCLKFNRLCEYYEVCDSSGEEAKLFKLESNYVDIDPFDVTKKLEGD